MERVERRPERAAEIRYLPFVNDEPDPTEVVMGTTRTVAYGSTTGPNTFVLKAVDAAGNDREPRGSGTLDEHVLVAGGLLGRDIAVVTSFT